MNTTRFSSLKFANRLKAAGMVPPLAEVLAECTHEALVARNKALLTQWVLRHELQLLEQRMTIKLGGLMVLAVGAVGALVKLV